MNSSVTGMLILCEYPVGSNHFSGHHCIEKTAIHIIPTTNHLQGILLKLISNQFWIQESTLNKKLRGKVSN